MSVLDTLEKAQVELDFRLLGLEYALQESMPQLVGALVVHLARSGALKLDDFEADLRADFNPDRRTEDSTGAAFAVLADLVGCYRRDGTDTARYSQVYEKVI